MSHPVSNAINELSIKLQVSFSAFALELRNQNKSLRVEIGGGDEEFYLLILYEVEKPQTILLQIKSIHQKRPTISGANNIQRSSGAGSKESWVEIIGIDFFYKFQFIKESVTEAHYLSSLETLPDKTYKSDAQRIPQWPRHTMTHIDRNES